MIDDRTPAERLEAQGFVRGTDFQTVGDILEKTEGEASTPEEAAIGLNGSSSFVPARLEQYPHPPLQSGIYFGLPEDVYLAMPALSTSGIKMLAQSPMIYWAKTPWLNPDYAEAKRREEEKRAKDGATHFNLGHAYDTRILEGKEAFDARFAVGLDNADHPDALVTLSDINEKLEGYGLKPKRVKADAFALLRELDPDAQLWDGLVAEHIAKSEGRTFITAFQYRQIEIAARMIHADEEMAFLLADGHPQVTLVWICPKTGILMKARADWLKIRSIIDMKSIANKSGRSVENAIINDIANFNYNLQPSVYFDGAEAVRKLIRAHGADVIFSPDQDGLTEKHVERAEWAVKWSKNTAPDEFLWIFQLTGDAPVTRLVHYPRGGTTKMMTDELVSRMKRRYRTMSETYGTDPWLDLAPRIDLADEDMKPWTTEI